MYSTGMLKEWDTETHRLMGGPRTCRYWITINNGNCRHQNTDIGTRKPWETEICRHWNTTQNLVHTATQKQATTNIHRDTDTCKHLTHMDTRTDIRTQRDARAQR